VVHECASRFFFLAAEPLSAAGGRRWRADADPIRDHRTFTPLLTYPRETRVRGFRCGPSGQHPRQRRERPINTPGFRACRYKTASGRHNFVNADPIGFDGGLNFYSYADGNPVSLMDPFGLGPQEVSLSWVQRYIDPIVNDLQSRYRYDLPTGMNWLNNASATLHAGLEYLSHGIQSFESSIGAPGASIAVAMIPGGAVVGQSRVLAANTTARTFTSTDPLVANLANRIEALYPGHVIGVNVPLRNAAGNLVTDADILLRNSVIQVKSGGSAQGLLRQLQHSEAATGLPSIGFGPNLPSNSLRTLSQQGGLVTRDEQLLLQFIKP
jgi:RHS repeat-associated protein